jgi:Icc-related predicted phosphoesterase
MPDIVVHATDLHGEIHSYERLLEIGAGKNVKAVIIGGDITPFLTASGDIAMYQREFLEYYLLPRLKDFKKKAKKDVFIMMGNDDLKINLDILEKVEKAGVFKLINQKVHKLGEKYVAGYTYVNETPFLLKDWEKSEEKIKKDLNKLAKLSNPKKTIYVMHAPPMNTALDVIFSGTHVGSKAIRDFILAKQPYLTLHGHIHESVEMTGNWREKLGKTVSVNPGKQNILVFDLNDLKTMEILAV